MIRIQSTDANPTHGIGGNPSAGNSSVKGESPRHPAA
jgi:hypothetical protein